jgi:pimeloyl-[acyl-carrier protein] methyl ester esterase
MRDDWRAFTRAYVPKVFAEGMTNERRELIDRMVDLVGDNEVESMVALWTSLVKADYVDAVRQLNVPTLITYGKLSQIYTEEAAEWMDQHIPNSQCIGFADSGHAPHLEEPQLFNESLAGFAEELQRNRNDIN